MPIKSLFFLSVLSFSGCDTVKSSKQVPVDESIKDAKSVIVIGSGPAGINAAFYAGRSGVKPYVISGDEPGGALTKTSYVENWIGEKKILGLQLVNNMKEQAQDWDAEFIDDKVVAVDFSRRPYALTLASGNIMHAHAIVIATGSKPKLLAIPGEKEYWGKGVTTCAICDAPFYKNKDVVVVGGGDSAAEEAIQLTSFAKKIYILVRKDRMRAADYLQKRLKSFENIEIVFNVQVQEIFGDDKHVAGVKLKDAQTGQLRDMAIDGVFLAIGSTPNTEIFKKYLKVDEQERLVLQERTQQTSLPGIFAAGDVEDPDKQAIIAAGKGCAAMLQALRWLNTLNIPLDPVTKSPEHAETPIKTPPAVPSKMAERASKNGLEEITSLDKLNALISSAKIPVIVDFYADYCSSCKKMMPYIEKASQTFAQKAVFYKVDAAQAPDIAKEFDVTSLPTILIFHKGTIDQRINKSLTYQEVSDFVSRVLEK